MTDGEFAPALGFALARRRRARDASGMPQFAVTELAISRDVTAIRAVCDGCDPARPCDEHAGRAWLWTVTAGAFQLRDRNGIHALDPTRAILMPAGHAFVIRHPAGPDVCVSYRGPLIEQLAASGPRIVDIAPARGARIRAALADGDPDGLAVAEELAAVADEKTLHDGPKRNIAPGTPADRALVDAISHVVRLDFAASTPLSEIAARAGYSVFHACRVFRATTGATIHGFRRELRLRHALSHLLDGHDSLADVASRCGFASQSHLTNLFRARYGITPAKARTRESQRKLCA